MSSYLDELVEREKHRKFYELLKEFENLDFKMPDKGKTKTESRINVLFAFVMSHSQTYNLWVRSLLDYYLVDAPTFKLFFLRAIGYDVDLEIKKMREQKKKDGITFTGAAFPFPTFFAAMIAFQVYQIQQLFGMDRYFAPRTLVFAFGVMPALLFKQSQSNKNTQLSVIPNKDENQKEYTEFLVAFLESQEDSIKGKPTENGLPYQLSDKLSKLLESDYGFWGLIFTLAYGKQVKIANNDYSKATRLLS